MRPDYSLVERVVGFDWLKRELLISIKKRAWNANCVQTQSGRKGGRFRLAETRATHFDKKRAWNANCVQDSVLVERVVGFDWLKRELLRFDKKRAWNANCDSRLRVDKGWSVSIG